MAQINKKKTENTYLTTSRSQVLISLSPEKKACIVSTLLWEIRVLTEDVKHPFLIIWESLAYDTGCLKSSDSILCLLHQILQAKNTGIDCDDYIGVGTFFLPLNRVDKFSDYLFD